MIRMTVWEEKNENWKMLAKLIAFRIGLILASLDSVASAADGIQKEAQNKILCGKSNPELIPSVI